MNITARQIARELGISRSNLYNLVDKGLIDIPRKKDGHLNWNQEAYEAVKAYVDGRRAPEPEPEPEIPLKTIRINNRRYLGNKYKLIPFIKEIVEQECPNIHTVADIFAGTGAVASAFTDRKVITNDNMYSNYICHVAWFGHEPYSEAKLSRLIRTYNSLKKCGPNYMTKNFSDTYFSHEDCGKIGYIRENIEKLYKSGEINGRERALLITSLLYAMDKIANTCGHYDAYRQGAAFEKPLELYLPQPEQNLNPNNQCYNEDTNELMHRIEADLVYIDPPYNSRQYCDAYHVLENVARWEKPKVFGVARKMDRTALKSDYCTIHAAEAFEDLVSHIHARYIMLSYNNMAEKGNDRSNAKISDEDICRILGAKGEVRVFSENYKAFTTGKSDIKGHEERLFLCICSDYDKPVIQSPLNYTGGKYKLLPQILPLFPKSPGQVVDLFCGGCNVGINVDCSKVRFNDRSSYLTGLFEVLKAGDKQRITRRIKEIIKRYGLTRSDQHSYQYYGCDSADGLGRCNKEGYLRLRKDFNALRVQDEDYYLMLYVLIVYSFNNQIRFNSRGEFNLPVGKRDFNVKMQRKLNDFIDRLKNGDYEFTNMDFREIRPEDYDENSFFYVDPPYLITCATYNERDGWTENDERDLLGYLDRLHERGIRFALSNVLENKGRQNELLYQWLEANGDRYRAVNLDYSYMNSNYQIKDKTSVTREVLVINYGG